jgi:hypothetical protein
MCGVMDWGWWWGIAGTGGYGKVALTLNWFTGLDWTGLDWIAAL